MAEQQTDYQKRNSAYRLLNSLGLEDNFEETIQRSIAASNDAMMKPLAEMGIEVPEEEKAQMDREMKAMTKKFMKHFDFSKFIDLFAEIYYEAFTSEEMDDLAEFFSKGVGQKWIKSQRDTAPRVSVLMSNMMVDLFKNSDILGDISGSEDDSPFGNIFGENEEGDDEEE